MGTMKTKGKDDCLILTRKVALGHFCYVLFTENYDLRITDLLLNYFKRAVVLLGQPWDFKQLTGSKNKIPTLRGSRFRLGQARQARKTRGVNFLSRLVSPAWPKGKRKRLLRSI